MRWRSRTPISPTNCVSSTSSFAPARRAPNRSTTSACGPVAMTSSRSWRCWCKPPSSAPASRTGLPFTMREPLVEHARAERLVEVKGTSGANAVTCRYSLTDLGRERAQQFLEINQYVGPTPVPLTAYVAQMKLLAANRGYMDRERLKQGFKHLIVDDSMLEKLGPAVNAGKALFLYGPPGNGKTVLAEGMGQSIGGDMYVPH